MQPFTQLTAIACALKLQGVDTDQLIPARFMKRSRAEGYGDVLLHDMRFTADGTPDPAFALHQPRCRGARILVARRNFGSGSSREAAVYALVDYGIACVIAPSFGDIFAANAVNNGLLPARVSEEAAELLLTIMEADLPVELSVDLRSCVIAAGEVQVPFAIEPVWRIKLLNGWDDLDLTLSHLPAIEAFARQDGMRRPWLVPSHTAER
jgi:3-isopropylmalate/(R)-2-methylmalate dehydratase small subunit